MSIPNPTAPGWVQRLYPLHPDRPPPSPWLMTPLDWTIHTLQLLSAIPLAVTALRVEPAGNWIYAVLAVFVVCTVWGLHRGLRVWAAQAHLAQWLHSDHSGDNPDDQLPGYRP